MNLHRVKHIPTGLYYQPGENNLSEKGKIYQNNQDCLMNGYGNYLSLTMLKTAKLLKKHPEWFDDWEDAKWDHKRVFKNISFDEFEREDIKTK